MPSFLSDDKSDFKNYIDNYIRSATEFHSAEELLSSRVPLDFVWKCLGGAALLGLLLCIRAVIVGNMSIAEAVFNAIVIIPFMLLLGYLIAFIMAGIKKGKCAFKFSGKTEEKIDTDDLIQFLNTHLEYLQPYFHDWGYMHQVALSMRGAMENTITDALRTSMQEVNIGTEFGEDRRRISLLVIRPCTTDSDLGKMKYCADARNRVEGWSFVSHDCGFAKYKCVYRTAPIIQAVMEYYLKNNIVERN